MKQGTTNTRSLPAGARQKDEQSVDPEVLAFRSQFESRQPLDELIRVGAQRMLQAAVDAEVEDFLVLHAERRDEQGRRLVIRNGRLPSRELLTGAGRLEVQQPRVRDNSPTPESRVQFSPSVLPAYLRKSPAIEELIPWFTSKEFRPAISRKPCKP